MNEQEIHIHLHIGSLEKRAKFRPRTRTKTRPKTTSSESELKTTMTRSLWERHMFGSFTKGLNPWINLQAARQAAASGQSVEVMGYEMEEARIAGLTVEQFKHTKGSTITPDDLVDYMIESGFKMAENYAISRELIESYLESRIELLGQAWTLSSYNISQLRSKVYQRDLELAS